MHNIQVFPTEVKCSCGFQKNTVTGGQANREGIIHALANTPSILKDHRKSTDDAVRT